ncbi:hypothetical protein PLEOSDRAFT_1087382 [Pleurotus ostreatus PC15]|uniref:Uncharacterized protein n=1 Tax=Pleurotus ostreatus (strain PC15) TaxID=1137138 RepID=A0A067NGN0_PLEO1|nr:hypothetical protein PLEOSDRAFT_1087382 [Pleurotus ostreatus PC15]
MMQNPLKWSLFALPASLGLFFGLFFGLSYPAGCSVVTIGAPLCSSQISLVNNAFSPSRCASDRSTCPPQIGQVCDGGLYPVMLVQSQSCTVSCPSCYSVDLTLRFGSGPTRGKARSAIYHQDFGKDEVSSKQFLDSHPISSSSRCFYNPKNPSQVSFDVSFTPWKWAVVSIFGIVPLFLNLAVLVTILGVIPAYRAINAKLAERRQRDVSETAFLVSNQGPQEVNVISSKEMSVDLEGTHDKGYSNADSDDEVLLLDAKGVHKF